MNAHPLQVVAPWYRTTPARARKGTAPVLQKYESSDLVNAFLKNPQHSLVFVNQVDRVDPVLGPRKLFLDSHKRFYLVVCEVHCDAPGFPNANPADICQAGFVIRRRRTELSLELKKAAEPKLKQLAVAAAKVARYESGAKRLEADLELNAAKLELREFAGASAVHQVVEGWRASPNLKKIGAWLPLADQTPESVEGEMSFPLYPLVPDPSDTKHAGHKRAIYFGLVPTGAAETDKFGHPRLDDKSLYEIRCFVRRHKPQCPRTFDVPDCHGTVFWSEPTEAFQLATPFDIDGTSNNPVNIPHPKLADLRARVGKPRFQPVRIVGAPELKASKSFPPTGSMADSDQICSFAIPLIFIVAYFIFSLFLPILLFLFNLYFLLALKLCIPPSIDVGLAASLDADVTPGSLGFSAGATFAIPGIDLSTHVEAAVFLSGLHETLRKHYGQEYALRIEADQKIQEIYELVRDRYQAEKETVAMIGDPSGPPPPVDPDKIDSGTPLTADLEYYADLRPA